MVVAVSGLVFTHGLFAQPAPRVEFPAASPACTLKQRVGLTDIEVVYCRPGVKGREIFGGLVPYGAVWRTGANQATRITFSTPVKFNGADVPAGTYALFTIPGENEWTIILNKTASQWGAFRYDPKEDLVRVKATPMKIAEHVETFTIEIDDIRDESATLYLMWDKTLVPVKLEMELTGKLLPQIQAAMAAPGKKPAGLCFQAATFYYNHGQDLKQALAWLDEGLAQKPMIAYELLHLKAEILAKQGDKAGAIAAARESKDLAIKAEGPSSSFVKMNDDLISNLQ
jgi:hypothetical protein